jgi:hypothetical protein
MFGLKKMFRLRKPGCIFLVRLPEIKSNYYNYGLVNRNEG